MELQKLFKLSPQDFIEVSYNGFLCTLSYSLKLIYVTHDHFSEGGDENRNKIWNCFDWLRFIKVGFEKNLGAKTIFKLTVFAPNSLLFPCTEGVLMSTYKCLIGLYHFLKVRESKKGSKFGSYVFSKIKKTKSNISIQNIGMSWTILSVVRVPSH